MSLACAIELRRLIILITYPIARQISRTQGTREVSMGLKIRNKMLTVTLISISVSQRARRIKTKVRKAEKKR